MEMFDGSPHFFKVMVGDFAHCLSIPPAFARKLRSEIGNGQNGVLQGPKGMRWKVKIWCVDTKIVFFGAGWEIFIYQNAIEFGDFLVFKYICGMYFRVRIFGKNGCEKDIPNFLSAKIQNKCDSQKRSPDLSSTILRSSDHLMNKKLSAHLKSKSTADIPNFHSANIQNDCDSQKRSPDLLRSSHRLMNTKLPVDLKRKSSADAENEVKKPKLSSQSHPSESPEHFHPSLTEKERQIVKSAKTKTEKKGGIQCHYVSSRRPVNATEKKKALEAAMSFVSENPFGLVIMSASMVYRLFRIRASNVFIDKIKLPRKRTEVTLVDPKKNEWPVRFLGDNPEPALIGGWRHFSIANNLEEGDACIFERVDDSKDKIKLNVHIFPVVKECSPYKFIKGSKRNDSLPSTTNKKTQVLRNDFATNSLRPEKGKCVKQEIEQLQGEKGKPSNESKFINLDKPKCKPSISERKAGCRRSLRLAQACHLSKCPKKELWDDMNVVILS
ncbi:B3 domain-containing protein Os01g0723500 isoform X1 [Cryptomeria japonica]|uniref:B3 domain-containing protein Os01g0723500 isoform X1 n=1 Tax=Cryptomeria japonica TaxID=3369 RepID=UPI0027DA6F99|nr:B3 domain-containing protein Os01g0723500 isoform X1 [Cryptomeria japonica]XP_057828624.2 B3 domain-containing protein Os01g0723500 isoform X1 [Cryptomeria japonica]